MPHEHCRACDSLGSCEAQVTQRRELLTDHAQTRDAAQQLALVYKQCVSSLLSSLRQGCGWDE